MGDPYDIDFVSTVTKAPKHRVAPPLEKQVASIKDAGWIQGKFENLFGIVPTQETGYSDAEFAAVINLCAHRRLSHTFGTLAFHDLMSLAEGTSFYGALTLHAASVPNPDEIAVASLVPIVGTVSLAPYFAHYANKKGQHEAR